MDILEHNRLAWNQEVEKGNQWTIPVTQAEIEAAAGGDFSLLLTPYKPVPVDWLGDVRGARVLCLASGGGQQGPLLAATGALVTVFDNSDAQLQRDRDLSDQYNLGIQTLQGNMQDMGVLPDESFDLVFHPVSNCFIDDILPVWHESARVLVPGGRLLAGFVNPLMYMLDWETLESSGKCELVHAIPYSDLETLTDEQKAKYTRERIPFEFGHSLSDLIQGQIAAGFLIAGFYEDKGEELLDPLTEVFIATLAIRT